MIAGRDALKRAVRAAVRKTPAADRYTKLTMRSLFSTAEQGIDALLTDEALLLEASRYGDVRLTSPERAERAEAVFAVLFIDRSPVSERAQAVLWSLKKLGLDAGTRDLAALRGAWACRPAEDRVPDALDMANLSSVAVQVGLLEEAAQPLSRFDERLRVSLSLDALGDAHRAWPLLAQKGCRNHDDVRALIVSTAERLEAESLLVTKAFGGALYESCVLPAAEQLLLPLVRAEDMGDDLADASALKARFSREGFSFCPYASAASAVEQLPGRWEQARKAIAGALVEAYAPLLKAGWSLSAGEIEHDIEQMLGRA